MFNLFVSIKPNIRKFTLLIEKVTFHENIKYDFFSTNFRFNRSILKIKQYAYGEKYLFPSHLKKTEMAQGRGWQGTFPICDVYNFWPHKYILPSFKYMSDIFWQICIYIKYM